MPEGDTIFRAARTLHRALAGQPIVRFESVVPGLTRVDVDRPIAGRRLESVTARGKHLLMQLSGDLVLHTHMRMNGSWHLYRRGERWQRPHRDMRVVVATHAWEAVGFNIPVAEFLSTSELARHPRLRQLGPDLAGPAFDSHEVVSRIRTRAADAIADLLIDQRDMAGIGNVLKSEILHVSGINPFAAAGSLSDEAISRLLDAAARLMRMNVADRTATLRRDSGRHTTGSMNPDRRLWVYGRGGKPCRRCGARIESRKTGPDARLTYWCPACQS